MLRGMLLSGGMGQEHISLPRKFVKILSMLGRREKAFFPNSVFLPYLSGWNKKMFASKETEGVWSQ